MIPNLDPSSLLVFYIVATEKSLTSAADKLCLTQPAITYRIKTLEEYTRVKLLEFKKRQVSLTPHGKELLTYAEKIYDQLVNAERFIKSIKEAYLRAGIASMYISIVGPVIKKMFEKYPEVRLTVRSGDAIEMVQEVLDSNLDIAIVPHFDYDKVKLQHNTVSAPQKIVCFASSDQIIQNEPLSWKELCNYPLISGPEESVIRRIIFNKFKNEGLEVRQLAAEVNNIEWCKTLVENGKGLSFTVIGDIEEEISKRRLKIVQLKEDLYLTAEAVTRSDNFSNPTIQEFVSMVKLAFGYAIKEYT